jgi:hypothetical protein
MSWSRLDSRLNVRLGARVGAMCVSLGVCGMLRGRGGSDQGSSAFRICVGVWFDMLLMSSTSGIGDLDGGWLFGLTLPEDN